ncbi:MAG TPA: DNA polymerase IV [Firmicutes bacterium]|jgi:DNA polymerase IV|nr:DNA polymerase IV [Bacillota bacterium]
MERKILHIDMDAFFAAVEQHDNPDYFGKPVIVGADPRGRGVVSTCSYEARKFGIHSAQPIGEAYRLCPQGIFLPVRGERYAQVSRCIMQLLSEYTPLIEPLSLDEAFLDLTGSEKIFGSSAEIGKRIVKDIQRKLGLSASIGIASNKFLAKLASDLQKPHGFVIITPENVGELLDGLKVNRLWGVGPKTEAHLQQLGIETIGMLRRSDPEVLAANFGEVGLQLYLLAHGQDDRPVLPEEAAKSIGHEITFQVDTGDRSFLAGVLLWLSDQVARRLRQQSCKGRIITVKIRDCNFKTLTKRTTLTEATDFEEQIYSEALKLVQQAAWGINRVRLLGVSVSGFGSEGGTQLGLFEEEQPMLQCACAHRDLGKLHQTVDRLRDRFGEGIITKGTILHVKSKVDRSNEPE